MPGTEYKVRYSLSGQVAIWFGEWKYHIDAYTWTSWYDGEVS